jgi:putative ABC transport system permease protein
MRTALAGQHRTVTSGADLAVRRAVTVNAATGVEVGRDPVSPSVLATIRSVPGVAQVQPVAGGRVLLAVGARGVAPPGASRLESWSPAPFNPYQLLAGRAPDADREIVLDVSTALTQKIRLGDMLGVQAARCETFRVVGLVPSPGDGPDSALALVSLPAAQRLLALGTGASDVDVRAADGAGIEALRSRLAGTLGPTYQVSARRDVRARITTSEPA